MTWEYCFRLLCLSLASFFLIHLVAALAVAAMAPAAIRAATRMRASAAARLMFAMRLGPSCLALIAVALLCVPSYLWLEPDAAAEPIGIGCLMAAICGATILARSLARALRAAVSSAHFRTQCRGLGSRTSLPGEALTVWVVEDEAPVFALIGIARPELVISRSVTRTLSREQMMAALRHEHAHLQSLDNLKRLLILAAPGMLPFFRGLQLLDRTWSRFAEWAADDYAAGDARASLSLAAALVRVARISSARRFDSMTGLAVSLLGDRNSLSQRVDRLLQRRQVAKYSDGRKRCAVWISAAIGGLGVLPMLMFHPATLASVHELLEGLNR